jgi:RNA polymerase sigma-70 factor (ECF subfamily)
VTGEGLPHVLRYTDKRLWGRENVNQILGSFGSPLVYGQLRRMAAYQMRYERRYHTLEPAALVHEAFLRLTNRGNAEWEDASRFLRMAAATMRRVLVDYARTDCAEKRGGRTGSVPLQDAFGLTETRSEELLALDEALTRLTRLDPRLGSIVQLRFFNGLTEEEIAMSLGTSVRTVKRDWSVARAWLQRELQ